LIIIITIPLSFIGAVTGLLVMNAPFGFMVSLGLYSLTGTILSLGVVPALYAIFFNVDATK